MKLPKSKFGLTLSSIYLVLAVVLIGSQGLFGESFIALILGLPWSLLLALIEYGHASGVLIYILLLGPIALNAYVFYWIGSVLSKK